MNTIPRPSSSVCFSNQVKKLVAGHSTSAGKRALQEEEFVVGRRLPRFLNSDDRLPFNFRAESSTSTSAAQPTSNPTSSSLPTQSSFASFPSFAPSSSTTATTAAATGVEQLASSHAPSLPQPATSQPSAPPSAACTETPGGDAAHMDVNVSFPLPCSVPNVFATRRSSETVCPFDRSTDLESPSASLQIASSSGSSGALKRKAEDDNLKGR
ncbi:hypothetical protein BDY24DRAFT_380956 [Mrakia frigida]|uniref:uncharacterized protein n=1 Tax=Mrakia frigida TaxID=29902 RepID=UPI003FCC140D